LKNLLLVVGSFFILVACSPKQEIERSSQSTIINENIPKVGSEPIKTISIENEFNKLAVIYPSKVVSKYAISTVNTITAYLIHKNKAFEIETFDTYDESSQSILKQIEGIKERGYSEVIALFTQEGFNILNSNNIRGLNIYFPLINKKEVRTTNDKFIFGGISYGNQIQLLKSFSSNETIMFYIESYMGDKLKSYTQNIFKNDLIIKKIKRYKNRYKYIMNDKRIHGSSILLNTPIIKSSIIMSQITAYEIEPAIILSTQLNYNPLLIKLTQAKDRTNFFVTNSIGKIDDSLVDTITELGGDVIYNWVDYSSLIGADYLLYKKENTTFDISSTTNQKDMVKLINSKIENNQVIYTPILYKSTSYGFKLANPQGEN